MRVISPNGLIQGATLSDAQHSPLASDRSEHLAACLYLVQVLVLFLSLALPLLLHLRTLAYVDPQPRLLPRTFADHETSSHYRSEGLASAADWPRAGV